MAGYAATIMFVFVLYEYYLTLNLTPHTNTIRTRPISGVRSRPDVNRRYVKWWPTGGEIKYQTGFGRELECVNINDLFYRFSVRLEPCTHCDITLTWSQICWTPPTSIGNKRSWRNCMWKLQDTSVSTEEQGYVHNNINCVLVKP